MGLSIKVDLLLNPALPNRWPKNKLYLKTHKTKRRDNALSTYNVLNQEPHGKNTSDFLPFLSEVQTWNWLETSLSMGHHLSNKLSEQQLNSIILIVKKSVKWHQINFHLPSTHLIGKASRTIDFAVSIKVIIELFGLVSKNCVPEWL